MSGEKFLHTEIKLVSVGAFCNRHIDPVLVGKTKANYNIRYGRIEPDQPEIDDLGIRISDHIETSKECSVIDISLIGMGSDGSPFSLKTSKILKLVK